MKKSFAKQHCVSLTRCKEDREIIEAEMAGPFEIIKDYFLKEFEFNGI